MGALAEGFKAGLLRRQLKSDQQANEAAQEAKEKQDRLKNAQDGLNQVVEAIVQARQNGADAEKLKPLAAQAERTYQMLAANGDVPEQSFMAVQQILQNALNTPSEQEEFQTELSQEKQKTTATETAKAEVKDQFDTPAQKQVFDKSSGKVIFASDEEIVKNENLVPFVKEDKEETPTFQSRLAVNPKTGETVRAIFNPKTGITTTEDGTPLSTDFITTTSTTQDSVKELTTKSKGKLEEDIIFSEDSLAGLESTLAKFEPELLQTLPRAKAGLLSFAEKLGKDLSPEQKDFVSRMATFSQDAIATVNATIKQITGAQMSEKEADRIRRQVPDPDNDGPTKFASKLRNSITTIKLAVSRKNWMLKNGIEHDFSQGESPVSIEQYSEIIEKRGEELQKQNPDLSVAEIGAMLKKEFDL